MNRVLTRYFFAFISLQSRTNVNIFTLWLIRSPSNSALIASYDCSMFIQSQWYLQRIESQSFSYVLLILSFSTMLEVFRRREFTQDSHLEIITKKHFLLSNQSFVFGDRFPAVILMSPSILDKGLCLKKYTKTQS